eukprot:scaffold54812_cov20-Tisochrysis_lutea.AAC.1
MRASCPPHAETQKVKDEDRRLQKELTQLQASTHADIERIRMEARESYDRWMGFYIMRTVQFHDMQLIDLVLQTLASSFYLKH